MPQTRKTVQELTMKVKSKYNKSHGEYCCSDISWLIGGLLKITFPRPKRIMIKHTQKWKARGVYKQ